MNSENKYSGILLTAGNSSRMNSWKPGALIDNIPVLYYSLRTISSVCSDIIVVGGHNFDELKKLVQGFVCDTASISCVENKSYNSGMFTSVKTGLEHTLNDNVFIALADMPFISPETYIKMIDRAENEYREADVIYPVIISHTPGQMYKKGHPVLIKKAVKERILNEKGDVILRDILKEFAGKQCLVTDAGINFDIDTEEDFERAKKFLFTS